jgi:hypothetical protein
MMVIATQSKKKMRELAGYAKEKMRNSTDAQRFRLPFPSLVSAV